MQKTRSYGFADAETQSIIAGEYPHLERIYTLIDWESLSEEVDRLYSVGKQPNGRHAYPGIVLFRMLLLGVFYRLSDVQTEKQVRVNLCFRAFAGLGLTDRVPDHSRLSRFRSELAELGGFDRLLSKVNEQLKAQGAIVQEGVIVDATITRSAARPRKAENNTVDPDADYTRKYDRTYYGYKAHLATDVQGLALSVVTTSASQHDGPMLVNVLNGVEQPLGKVYADKGYDSEENRRLVELRGGSDGIKRRKKPGEPDSEDDKERNREIEQVRYAVERTFGSMKRWFIWDRCRYVGMDRVAAFHALGAIAYNLFRLPRLMAARA